MGAVRKIRQVAQESEPKLSERLWGIDWSNALPRELPCGVVVMRISEDESLSFMKHNLARLFHFDERPNRFVNEESAGPKQRYYALAGDFFGFFSGDELVGISVCAPSDWSTYNIRHVSVLEAHQKRGIWNEFLEVLAEVLSQCGVDRLEGDISPTNLPNMHAVNKFGFMATGLNMTDRWGALVHVTFYLNENHQRVFEDQFCVSVHHTKEGQR